MNSTQSANSIVSAMQIFEDKVKELAAHLSDVTFGYICNCERWGDDRLCAIFLPHAGRVGSFADSVSIGRTEKLAEAVAKWDALAGLVATARSASNNRRKSEYKCSGLTAVVPIRPAMVPTSVGNKRGAVSSRR